MSFFSKKENDELFSLIENSDNDNGDLSSEHHFSPFNPHALTPEEVSGFSIAASESKAQSTSALEALKKRMLNTRTGSDLTDERPNETDISSGSKHVEPSLAVPDVKENKTDGLFSFVEDKKEDGKTLLEKCRPFIIDDNGKDSAMKSEASYKLESVEEILKNDTQKTLDRLSEKYDVSFDDLGKKSPYLTNEDSGKEKHSEENNEIGISHIISDIDNSDDDETPDVTPDISSTATIRFTPVSDSDSSTHISVSSATRPIDLTGELTKLSADESTEDTDEVKLEQTDFEDYSPQEEFKSQNDAKHFLRQFSINKRSAFLKTVLSVILTAVLAFMKLPFMSGIILKHTKSGMIICTVLLGIIMLVNCDMFVSLKNIFSRRCNGDILAVTSSLTVTLYAITGIIKNEITLDIILLCAVILSLRALGRFFSASANLTGFKQISSSSPKRAVKLISDSAVTFAMAKNSVEGDVLAAAPQRTEHIDDYMKYSTYGTVLNGKLPLITAVAAVLSVILGFACASYFDGVIYGFYSAAAVQCLAAMPCLFFIDSLPLYSSAKRLGKLGSVIAGKTGAERVEKANAAVFDSEDIFPSGTVTLHQLRMLSSNSIDDTIIRAASLTDSLNSPLAPILKKIAGTDGSVVLPASDTVKYEDKMGISGWVDNKLLFVGNRTLMEAHGIEVPSVEVDRKILRQGYFPVYVASEDKACALLVVQYSVRPDIARELRRISALGITMLINSSDPNMTEEMICDYMGLYDDSVKVMSAAGCHMYKNAVTFVPHCSAPAAYKGNPVGLAAIISNASRIKKSNILLTTVYVLAAVLGIILFAYSSFDGSGTLISSITVLIYSLVSTAISLIFYLTQKP